MFQEIATLNDSAETDTAPQSTTMSYDILSLLQPGSALGKVTPVSGGVRIDGAAAPWGFIAVAPFSVPGPLEIVLDVTVQTGRLAIGVLSASGPGTLDDQELSAGDGSQLRIRIADGAACRGVVLRHFDDSAPSATAIIRRMTLFACDYHRYPLAEAMQRQIGFAAQHKPAVQQALLDLEADHRFGLSQGLTLAAVVNDFQPSVIIDLGTCSGSSSFAMAVANPNVPIYTFDIYDFWNTYILPRVPEPPPRIHPIVGDITTFDFTTILEDAERVLIFWDAHGFEIAGRIFSHIMPMIASKPHVIFCHDVSDNRFDDTDLARSYCGKQMFRGYTHYDANMPTTARGNIGWMTTAVDQGIALTDFSYRNRLTICSVDWEFKTGHTERLREEMIARLYPEGLPTFDLIYFTMNETYLRHFPLR